MTRFGPACNTTHTEQGHLLNKEMLSVHTLETIQTQPGSQTPENEQQLRKQ